MKLHHIHQKRFAHGWGQLLENRNIILDQLDAKLGRATPRINIVDKALSAYKPVLNADDDPKDYFLQSGGIVRDAFTIDNMLSAGMHLGHRTALWSPRMAPFIHGTRHGIHIIDLDKSLVCLRQASQVCREIARLGGIIVFFGNRNASIARLCYESAVDAEQYYINGRWVGGTLTNADHVLSGNAQAGGKRAIHASNAARGLDYAKMLGSQGTVLPKPHLLVLLHKHDLVMDEAEQSRVPTIGLCDTNNDPTKLTYPVPGNDDGYASVELFTRVLARASWEGKRDRERGDDGKTPDGLRRIIDSATTFARDALNQHHPGLFHAL